MSDIKVIDLSHWNEVSDFHAVKAAGVIGVIHKATEGVSYFDDTYNDRREAATAAGLEWAAYHFMRPGIPMGDQMAWFMEKARMPFGGRLVLDYEAEGLVIDDLHDCLDWFSIHAPDMQICIYSGHLIKEQLGNDLNEDLATCSLWIAHYTSAPAPSWPYGTWPAWTLWQYTDKASVPGIIGPCDANRFNGSNKNCKKWFGPVEPAPSPEPEPAPAEVLVVVSIEAPEGVNVGVIVNGKVIT